MAEYKFVDLPSMKVDSGKALIAEAITRELNAFSTDGWSVVNAVDSRIIGKTGFLLTR